MEDGKADTDKMKSNSSRPIDRPHNSTNTRNTIVKKVLVSATILAATLTISTVFLRSMLPPQELMYLQAAEVAAVGYVILEIVSTTFYSLLLPGSSSETAKAIRSLIRITGTIIIVAAVISFLAKNPIVA